MPQGFRTESSFWRKASHDSFSSDAGLSQSMRLMKISLPSTCKVIPFV